ncbi:hypothetical protein JQN58_18900 [Aneurinibacillus sp. BA2021]|nr:hypothetical protein [Aneurinibacillus sp. BA2021]
MGQIQQEKTYQHALHKATETILIPKGYEFKSVRSGKQNEADVWVFRYEKTKQEDDGLGGEHYSFTVDQDGYRILGITWMDQHVASGQQLPSEKRTKELVQSFLNRTQPGLFERLENHWIRPHDRPFPVFVFYHCVRQVIPSNVKNTMDRRDESEYFNYEASWI